MSDHVCRDCGWTGDHEELSTITYDGEHVRCCPRCTGIDLEDVPDDEE